MENSANYHADEAGISKMNKKIDISRRAKEILDKEPITSKRITITKSQLKHSGIMTHHDACNREIIFRQER